MLKYQGVLITVEDIAAARRFYEDCLQQKVGIDFGVNVSVEGGLAIHLKSHFQELLGGEPFAAVKKAHDGELYFETDELTQVEQRVKEAGVEFIHPVREQPWAQRVMRFYDPDGHVVEVGETMESTVRRLFQEGNSVEAICRRTGMPKPFVEGALVLTD